jgi:hypothetical protein
MRRRGAALLACLAVLPAGPCLSATETASSLPRLCGIVVAGPERVAIFELAPGVTTAAAEGEQVGPYLIRGITMQEVRVEQDGRALNLAIVQSGGTRGLVDNGGVTFGVVVNPQSPPDD